MMTLDNRAYLDEAYRRMKTGVTVNYHDCMITPWTVRANGFPAYYDQASMAKRHYLEAVRSLT